MSKIDISAFLKAEVRNSPFIYCMNPGNAGDALISLATLQLFRRLNLSFSLITTETSVDLQGQTVVYAGGGNLVPLYGESRRFLRKHHASAQRLILLPQTITDHEDLLAALGRNTTVFCRESVSLAHVNRHARNAQVLAADDMALLLDTREAMKMQPRLEREAAVWHFRRILKAGSAQLLNRCARFLLIFTSQQLKMYQYCKGIDATHGVLNAFRADIEKIDIHLSRDNLDVSRALAFGCDTEANVYLSANRLLRYLDTFKEIFTNRLHVAIGGALLGKRVRLYPNNYHKCCSVYDFSLKERFPNVSFHHGPASPYSRDLR